MQRMLALLLLGASVPAGADIYKWTDENGRVHFGDSAAGTGKQAEAVAPGAGSTRRPPAGTASSPDADQIRERQRRLLDTLQREAAQRDAEAARQALARQRQESECQRLRDILEKIDGRAIAIPDANGERQYLSDAQRQDYVDKSNNYLKQNCQ